MCKNKVTYEIRLDDIIVPDEFKNHPPRISKLASRIVYFLTNCEFKTPMVINNKFQLVDGYTSYLIAKQYNIMNVQVEFRNNKRKK